MPVRLTDLDESVPLTDGAERLERGEVLRLAPGSVPLPDEEDLEFLRSELPKHLASRKNISYLPTGDYLSGLDADDETRGRVRSILADRDQAARTVLGRLLPDYAKDWRIGKVNFRPLEERGRELVRHSSNELLHVDAYASGATHGDRVLRFFTNVHPTESRVWLSAGTFADLYPLFSEKIARGKTASNLRPGLLDRAWSGTLRGLSGLGLSRAELADSSPYDRAMKRFHDVLKDDEEFQEDPPARLALEFPPFSSWIVMTDVVSHAVVSGRHALVNTYYVKRARERCPEISPWSLLASS